MRQAGMHSQRSRGRRFVRCAAIAAGVALVLAACGDDSGSSTGTTALAATTTPADPVAAAQADAASASDNTAFTATPIKYLVVVFQENAPFAH